MEQFEKEVGYKFRAEYIIDQGYYNNQYRIPSKEYKDFQAFQRREVAKIAKEMVDITHEHGKKAMMFLGDHWIGTEPFLEEFKTLELDAIVGSVGNGSTLRLISDIEGVKYTEGRLLPYFFPDVFCEGGDPVKEAKYNWVTARRAILRKPIDRIGYGGYLKLACAFPEFIDYVESVCNEFRELYDNIKGTTPYCVKTVAVLNCWGKMRAWGCHMVHHALYQKQNYSYAGVIEALSGAPFDVRFISFDDLRADAHVLDGVDVLINVGDGDTAHTGGGEWEDPAVAAAVRGFVYNGGGIVGVGEPSGHQYEGHYLQLAGVLGVEKETGFTLGYDKYNWDEHPGHFILEDCTKPVDFGEGKKSIYALPGTEILVQREKEVQMAVHAFGRGRAVYISGLPYSFENSRVLYRSILWSAHDEESLHKWFSSNFNVEVHAYVKNGKYCVVNNTYEPQSTVVYKGGWKNDRAGREYAYDVRYWRQLPERIAAVAERLKDAQIEQSPAVDVIRRFRHPDVLIYADPPYMLHTRKGKQYIVEMAEEAQHIELLDALKEHPGPVILSGYDNDLYNEHLQGWKKLHRRAQAEGGAVRTETVWLNYVPETGGKAYETV